MFSGKNKANILGHHDKQRSLFQVEYTYTLLNIIVSLQQVSASKALSLVKSNTQKVSKIFLIKKKDCCTEFLMLGNNLTLSLDLINKFRLVFGVGGWEIFSDWNNIQFE